MVRKALYKNFTNLKSKLLNYKRCSKMESEFDVNKLIEIANKHYPKFYKEFISIFNDNKEAMTTSIKLAINIEDDKYKDEFITYKYDFYSIIKDTGIFYKIYKNEKNFYDDFVREK